MRKPTFGVDYEALGKTKMENQGSFQHRKVSPKSSSQVGFIPEAIAEQNDVRGSQTSPIT